MKNKVHSKILIYLIIVAIIIYSFIGSKGELVENQDIPIGVGYDLEGKSDKDVIYNIPLAIYLFESNKIDSVISSGKARNIGESRENRQTKSNKKFLLGLERVFILSEKQARFGIRTILDILLNNPQINDNAFMAVCSGKAEDILKSKIKGYSNPAEFIEGLIKNSTQFNFFTEEYSLIDVLVRVDTEGRSVVLPYIELKEDKVSITGLAIFKGDKMVAKTNIEEAKLLNLISNDKAKGILTLQNNSKEYINFYAESKRKVKCYKEGEKFRFVIDLNLKGPIISNTLYNKLNSETKVLKEFAKDMEKSVQKMCEDFVNNKIKGEYKIDTLDLGRVAVAKYGRGKGIDWDKAISDSIIEVNVKVEVDTEGRGDYQLNSEK